MGNRLQSSNLTNLTTQGIMIFFLTGQFLSVEEDHLVDPAFINRIQTFPWSTKQQLKLIIKKLASNNAITWNFSTFNNFTKFHPLNQEHEARITKLVVMKIIQSDRDHYSSSCRQYKKPREFLTSPHLLISDMNNMNN